MIRRKYTTTGSQKNRWMITYADFMTLMFALFAALYSISFYNENHLWAIIEELKVIFKPPAANEKLSTTVEQLHLPAMVEKRPKPLYIPQIPSQNIGTPALSTTSFVRQPEQVIEIELDSNLLFQSGSATLSPKATPLLRKVADSLIGLPHPITVEGHTDNMPIRSNQFPSNWELSIYRASRVVRELAQLGIPPNQLSAIGYGDQQPIADNRSPKGRKKNRRVVIVVNVQ